jgi:hypothetical protein
VVNCYRMHRYNTNINGPVHLYGESNGLHKGRAALHEGLLVRFALHGKNTLEQNIIRQIEG